MGRVRASLQLSLKFLTTQTQAVSRQDNIIVLFTKFCTVLQITSLMKPVCLPHLAWFHWRRCDCCSTESRFTFQISEAEEEENSLMRDNSNTAFSPCSLSLALSQYNSGKTMLFHASAQVFLKSCSPSPSNKD